MSERMTGAALTGEALQDAITAQMAVRASFVAAGPSTGPLKKFDDQESPSFSRLAQLTVPGLRDAQPKAADLNLNIAPSNKPNGPGMN